MKKEVQKEVEQLIKELKLDCTVEEFNEHALPEEMVLHTIIASKTRDGVNDGQ